MRKRPQILELRDSQRRSIEAARKPLTRAEIERLVDERVDQRVRHLLRQTPSQTRRGGCG